MCGYKRTGKDTFSFERSPEPWLVYAARQSDKHVASTLFRAHWMTFVAFAAPLKRACGSLPERTEEEKAAARVVWNAAFAAADETQRRAWLVETLGDEPIRGDECKMVTDFRMPYQLDYARTLCDNVVTVRLFRSEVPVPPADEYTEHALDTLSTTLLLVKSEPEFAKACALWPQYGNYVKLDVTLCLFLYPFVITPCFHATLLVGALV